MTRDVEETLRRTLGHAAGQAPELPAGPVVSGVEVRYRRRRQRRQALLAAAAVVVVAGGVAGGLRAADRAAPATPDPAATATALPSASPAPSHAARPEPIASVWPQALRKVPAKTPEGAEIAPILLIGDRTLLVSTAASFEKTGALYAYDLETLDLRKLTDVVTPEGTVLFASGFDAGRDHVAWWTQLKDGTAQIWAAPLGGGEARLIGSQVLDGGREVDGGGVDKLEITGDRVVFSATEGGVFSVPLGGGEVEPVEGGAGMHLLSWPWIGTPGPYGPADGARYGLIRNVETGETDRALERDGEEVTRCTLTHCIGLSGGTPFYRLRDGSQQKELPGMVRNPPFLDRFYISVVRYGERELGMVLYDLRTGKSADFGFETRRSDNGGLSIMSPRFEDDSKLIAYPIGGTLHLVDLTKIT